MFHIYSIQNNINFKIYIGQSKHPQKRWQQHKNTAKLGYKHQVITRAITKYGYQNFTFQILRSYQTREDVNKAEGLFINLFNSTNKLLGYNIKPGGMYSGHSKKTIEKIRLTMLNRTEEEKREIYSRVSKTLTGIKHSDERRKNISEGHKSIKPSAETRKKLSKTHNPNHPGHFKKGRRAPETAFKPGHIPSNKGKSIWTKNRPHPNTGNFKLSPDEIKTMHKLYKNGITKRELAKMFNASISTIDRCFKRILPSIKLHKIS